jgi:hypothetical protein
MIGGIVGLTHVESVVAMNAVSVAVSVIDFLIPEN